MISYIIPCMVVGTNLVVYVVIHILLELYYFPKKRNIQNLKSKPQAWNNSLSAVLTILPSLYFWILFVIIPLSLLFEGDLFYSVFFLRISTMVTNILQLIGLVFVVLGTILAILGRVARGEYAISWGIPTKIINKGIFKYIRHPLYSSYILFFIGFQLTFLTLIMTPLLFGIIGYYLTTIYEEELLINKFGDQYIEYKSRTKMFFPFIF